MRERRTKAYVGLQATTSYIIKEKKTALTAIFAFVIFFFVLQKIEMHATRDIQSTCAIISLCAYVYLDTFDYKDIIKSKIITSKTRILRTLLIYGTTIRDGKR